MYGRCNKFGNQRRLQESLDLRWKIALAQGRKSYAEHRLSGEMAQKPSVVWHFLNDLKRHSDKAMMRHRLKISCVKQYVDRVNLASNSTLGAAAAKDGGDANKQCKLRPWDRPFYENTWAEQAYEGGATPEEVRDYFPTKAVIPGMLDVFQDFLDITFTEVAKKDAPPVGEDGVPGVPGAAGCDTAAFNEAWFWHPGVKCYAVRRAADFSGANPNGDSTTVLGHLCLDLWSRRSKSALQLDDPVVLKLRPGYQKADGTGRRQSAGASIVASLGPNPFTASNVTLPSVPRQNGFGRNKDGSLYRGFMDTWPVDVKFEYAEGDNATDAVSWITKVRRGLEQVAAGLSSNDPDHDGRMLHSEVVELFGAVGKAMEIICGRSAYALFSGGLTESDTADVPSLVGKALAWDQRVVKRISNHVKQPLGTAPLPPSMMAGLRRTRAAGLVPRMASLLFDAFFDMKVHSLPPRRNNLKRNYRVRALLHMECGGVCVLHKPGVSWWRSKVWLCAMYGERCMLYVVWFGFLVTWLTIFLSFRHLSLFFLRPFFVHSPSFSSFSFFSSSFSSFSSSSSSCSSSTPPLALIISPKLLRRIILKDSGIRGTFPVASFMPLLDGRTASAYTMLWSESWAATVTKCIRGDTPTMLNGDRKAGRVGLGRRFRQLILEGGGSMTAGKTLKLYGEGCGFAFAFPMHEDGEPMDVEEGNATLSGKDDLTDDAMDNMQRMERIQAMTDWGMQTSTCRKRVSVVE